MDGFWALFDLRERERETFCVFRNCGKNELFFGEMRILLLKCWIKNRYLIERNANLAQMLKSSNRAAL